MPSFHQSLLALLANTCLLLCSSTLLAEEPPVDSTSAKPATPSASSELSIDEIRSLLDSIDPYLPEATVAGEIDLFGSTSMDSLAHGWVHGFEKFHPEAKVVISAEGSETVFDRLLKNPASIGMLSRPVTEQDLARLKSEGLKRPVAIKVARDALGVFVHADNPLEVVSYPQLVTLFCSEDPSAKVKWSAVGVEGTLADQPVQIIGRTKSSGTRKFVEQFLFHSHQMRTDEQYLETNAEVLKTVGENPQAIAIVDLSYSNDSVKRLHLRDQATIIEDNDHEVLIGRYPIIRPLTLVLDLGQNTEKAVANREFVRYALTQTGQTQAILSGFYPFDPPTLRAETEKLRELGSEESSNTASKSQELK